MKKLFLTAVLALFAASSVMAEEVPQKPSFKGFETNGFWDNWEISIGAGATTAFSSGDNMGKRADRIGWELNGSLTKWFHPVVGVRGQLMGGQFSNFYVGATEASKWDYIFGHFDAMINLSNWIGGYREDRVYYAVPFVGAGLMASGCSEQFAMTAGLLNKFRVCKQLDVNLELKASLAKTYLAPRTMYCRFLGALSATVGVTYRFNKRDFARAKDYTAADLKVYQDAAAVAKAEADAAAKESARLSDELKDANAEVAATKKALVAAEAKEVVPTGLENSAVVIYTIGQSRLSSQEKTRLDLIAHQIKNGDKNHVYTIVGTADSQTGSAALNQRLSEARAKNVYDYLVKQGVNPDQLTYEGKGGVEHSVTGKPDANRAAVIK